MICKLRGSGGFCKHGVLKDPHGVQSTHCPAFVQGEPQPKSFIGGYRPPKKSEGKAF